MDVQTRSKQLRYFSIQMVVVHTILLITAFVVQQELLLRFTNWDPNGEFTVMCINVQDGCISTSSGNHTIHMQ